MPDLNIFFGVREANRVVFSFLLGLLPFMDIDPNIGEFPFPFFFSLRNQYEKALGKTFYGFMPWLKPLASFLKKILNYHLRKRGIPMVYWVTNDERDIDTALGLGAKGVMSDNPSETIRYLKSKNLFK